MKKNYFFRKKTHLFYSLIAISLATPVVLFFGCAHNQNTNSKNEDSVPNLNAKMGKQDEMMSRDPSSSYFYVQNPGNPDVDETKYLNQGWSAEIREGYYRTPQGSHILPLKFALVLEQSKSEEKFFTSENLSRYGYIPQKANDKTNPYGLPVGFTVDGRVSFKLTSDHKESAPTEVGDKQLGINCAACHTANLKYQGKTIRIDGGQGFPDFQSFVADMDNAIFSTVSDNKKMNRLIKNVLDMSSSANSSGGDSKKLLNEFNKLVAERKEWNRLNASKFKAGPSRVDAFSIIFNQVIARDLGIFTNHREPVNPVSYPVVWDGPHHDFVQWNGLASNHPSNGGPLARNTGEVLGVFGRVDLSKTTKILNGYCSTVRRDGLLAMEDWLTTLTSPKWPEDVLPPIDQTKLKLGSQIYQNKCASCHAVLTDTTDPKRQITAKLIRTAEVGTDPKFNNNALSWVAKTGKLEGRQTRLKKGRKLEANEPAVTVLKHVVAGSMVGTISPITCSDSMETTAWEIAEKWFQVAKKTISNSEQNFADDDPNPDKRIAALTNTLDRYKARPLNGIWSSAPFLHNGSVKNLYELLSPVSERSPQFFVGCEEFDAEKVGISCEKGFKYDTSLPGNQNIGHAGKGQWTDDKGRVFEADYGTDLSPEDRMALIEYIKTL